MTALRIDANISNSLSAAAADAVRHEQAGYHGVWTPETKHDPFLPLVLAAEHTERVELGTAIAVAFARNPMNLANLGYDLQAYSGGRFVLGLGSQVQAHIEKRFSMPWSHPAARMRELILAMRAIWDAWEKSTPLRFEGQFYRHTLMTPFFDPGPNPYGLPKVLLAAVGEKMTETAGEVADGILLHAFTTMRYLREVTLPALARGHKAAGRDGEGFELSLPAFVVSGTTEEEMAEAAVKVREQIAFYGSTPAYRGVLELHGWGDLQTELHRLSKQGEWKTMGTLVEDEVLRTFAAVGPPKEAAAILAERLVGLVDRVNFYIPYRPGSGVVDELLAELKALTS